MDANGCVSCIPGSNTALKTVDSKLTCVSCENCTACGSKSDNSDYECTSCVDGFFLGGGKCTACASNCK